VLFASSLGSGLFDSSAAAGVYVGSFDTLFNDVFESSRFLTKEVFFSLVAVVCSDAPERLLLREDRSEVNEREISSTGFRAMIVNVGIQAPTSAKAGSRIDQIVERAVSSISC